MATSTAMRKVYIAGRPISLAGVPAIGTGGEADVYSIGGGLALKIYKGPDHPDLQTPNAREREALALAALERLGNAQRKLRLFPRNLPPSVLGPLDLAYDGPGKDAAVVGFTMPYLAGADLLYHYGKRKFREEALGRGLTFERVREGLLDLHRTVEAVHAAGVVIGDFNDLNVLVKEGRAYLVDADSFQYGGFLSRGFQYRFVDPRICDPCLDHLELCLPHSEDSDWYAYSVMVLQCLLYVDPYSGLYKPAAPGTGSGAQSQGKGSGKVAESARPLHHITIFSPDVRYPRPAIPYRALPDDLLEYFVQTFVHDHRGTFPAYLLEGLAWTRCPFCGAEHARAACPFCLLPSAAPSLSAPPLPPAHPRSVWRGVTATLVFETEGQIVTAAVHDGHLCWLYQEGGDIRREDGGTLLRGGLSPGMKVCLSSDATHIARGPDLVTLRAGRVPERRAIETIDEAGAGTGAGAGATGIPAFAANASHLYWIEGGRLYRDSALGPYRIGDVLSHATRIWVGELFGLGYYRAGGLGGTLLFDAERAGLKSIDLGLPPGQILDAACEFGPDHCWFLAAIKEPRGVMNHCVLVGRDGHVLAHHSTAEGGGSWLGTLNGKCAAGTSILCATDDGVVRVEESRGAIIQTYIFPDTAPHVDSATHLFAGRDGLYAVTDRTIHLLRPVSPASPVLTP